VPAVLGRAVDAVLADAGRPSHSAGGWLTIVATLLGAIVAGNAVAVAVPSLIPHAALRLATTILIVGRLIDWCNRWNPN
jgi:hypothetical protein